VRLKAGLALAGVLAVLVGCAPDSPAPPPQFDRPERTFAPAFPGAATLPPPDLRNDGPGSLVAVAPVTGVAALADGDITAVKVIYRSTAGADGAPINVSGVVAVPPGQPPKGGWPIMVFGHPATGVLSKCAPTRAPDLWSFASMVAMVVARGYVVAMPDYPGIGIESVKPSLVDAMTLGNNAIDAARVARRVTPSAGTKWAAMGLGVGGTAAWSAAERAGIYGAGLDMVGAVAISPYADLTPLVDLAEKGTWSDPQQYRFMIWVLQSVANMDPAFNLDLYRSGTARDHWDTLVDCAPQNPQEAQQQLKRLQPGDLRPRDAGAAADLRRRLTDLALPAKYPTPGAAPVLVIFGTGETMVPPWGTQRAVAAACAKGDVLEVTKRLGDRDKDTAEVSTGAAFTWLQARFDGQRLGNVCVGAS
jgi:alpha-beta hydrolase superfamily lysophospholipase